MNRLNEFDCNVLNINTALLNACKHGNNSAAFVFDDGNKKKVIGACVYCCPSFKVEDTVHPAIEIKTFAIDKNYQDSYFEDSEVLCSAFVFNLFADHLCNIKTKYIYAEYIILYALDRNKVKSFYEKNGFVTFKAGDRSLRDVGEYNNEYSMFKYIGE